MISQSMILAFGWTEIAVVAVIVLLLFGGKKIPELMKGLGGGLKEFKKASSDDPKETEKTKEKGSENKPPKKENNPGTKEEDPVTFKEKK